jgi:hypothetical protein
MAIITGYIAFVPPDTMARALERVASRMTRSRVGIVRRIGEARGTVGTIQTGEVAQPTQV